MYVCKNLKPKFMKKLLLIISIMPFCLKAQISITQADYAGIGDSLTQFIDSVPQVLPGNAGSNETWTLTGLKKQKTSLLTFVNPASISFGVKFPKSNLCMNLDNKFNFYLEKNASKIQLWGVSGDILMTGTPVALVYSNPETKITFPTTYNTTFSDTSYYDRKEFYGKTVYYGGFTVYVDSARNKHVEQITSIVDGSGNVITPNGTFPALRQKVLKHVIDSIWAKIMNNWIYISALSGTYNITSYDYLAKNIGNSLVRLTCDTNSTTAVVNAEWINAFNNASVNENSKTNEFRIYPLPANEHIFIENSGNQKIYFIISDITGREIYRSEWFNNSMKLSTLDIINGLYLLNIYDQKGIRKTEKIIINH